MAQRKAKEPLLAEVPRPRLSDEELMELFYSGQRKEKERQKDEDDIPGTVAASEESSGEQISHKPYTQEPFLTEGYAREHSYREPLINTPIQPRSLHSVESEQPSDKSPHSAEIVPDSTKGQRNVQTFFNPFEGPPEKPFPKKPSFKEPTQKEPSKEESSPSSVSAHVSAIGKQVVPDTFRGAFEVLPTLGPLEQLFYLWFLNLSHAVGQPSCRATMALLQRATGVSEKLVRETLRSLLGRRYLKLLDGGAAGRAALYLVAHPREIMESKVEGHLQEPSIEEPYLQEAYAGKVPYRNLPEHIERESIIYTLSQREPFSQEGSPQEGFSRIGFARTVSGDSVYPPALLDSVLDRFYSMTGQTRISRQKRERSRAQLLDLLRQGFRLDEVLSTIEWARAHITTPIHSFGIIPEIIGQALGRHESRHERPPEQSQSPVSSAPTGREAHDHQRIAEIQAALAPEERAAIQQEAERLIEKEYGPHVPGRNTLVRIKVAEILRERYLQEDPSGKNDT
jgi:hypothetical protein